MTTLYSATITAPLTAAVGPVYELEGLQSVPFNVCVQGKFVYGSGGTTAQAWLQTSLDGGNTWCDIAPFSFTTASLTNIFNLSSLTPNATAKVPTDGSASAAVDGLIGTKLRVKVTTTGTYAGNTTLTVDVATSRLESR